MKGKMSESFLELVRLAACDLAPDVEKAIRDAIKREEGRARSTLDWMLKNADEARKNSTPICQDTGSLLFKVRYGPGARTTEIEEAIKDAVVEATRRSYLRPNAVDPVTGKNSGNNLGLGSPTVHFEPIQDDGRIEARLVLKGGGSENCGVQYSLPDSKLKAGRDMLGIKRCILDAAFKAQGFGCAPGTLGVGIGGDRMSSYLESKEQLYRMLDDTNSDPLLAGVEEELCEKINRLEIGPMGFGGLTTVLGVKIGKRHRLPACFFVSMSYMCWAYRRRAMQISGDKVSYS